MCLVLGACSGMAMASRQPCSGGCSVDARQGRACCAVRRVRFDDGRLLTCEFFRFVFDGRCLTPDISDAISNISVRQGNLASCVDRVCRNNIATVSMMCCGMRAATASIAPETRASCRAITSSASAAGGDAGVCEGALAWGGVMGDGVARRRTADLRLLALLLNVCAFRHGLPSVFSFRELTFDHCAIGDDSCVAATCEVEDRRRHARKQRFSQPGKDHNESDRQANSQCRPGVGLH